MKDNKKNKSISFSEHVWITDRAWVTGIIGALSVVAFASWYSAGNILINGVSIKGFDITLTRNDSILFALISICLLMLFAETIRLYLINRNKYFTIHPYLKKSNFIPFLLECFFHYFIYLLLIWLVIYFFHTAGEYGFKKEAAYYRVWFRFLEIVWEGYLWLGLLYVVITRAIKYDNQLDKLDLAAFVIQSLQNLNARIYNREHKLIESSLAKHLRSLLVKLFFAPLMTVFFADQFPHLVNNIGYISMGLWTTIQEGLYTHKQFNSDLFNISVAFIFSVDVALAWTGYVSSSRWVGNQTVSAEPTMLGWVVCLICYPPFQMFLGLYYGAPGERDILNLNHHYLVTFFSLLMIASYFIYMWSTLCFGVRFSNLTHRGIIRSGPYSIVRHPAYASKNFAWWCIMFPAILFNLDSHNFSVAMSQILGLALMTWVYFWRALTEERHLKFDPDYQTYCNSVSYRFIPKLL